MHIYSFKNSTLIDFLWIFESFLMLVITFHVTSSSLPQFNLSYFITSFLSLFASTFYLPLLIYILYAYCRWSTYIWTFKTNIYNEKKFRECFSGPRLSSWRNLTENIIISFFLLHEYMYTMQIFSLSTHQLMDTTGDSIIKQSISEHGWTPIYVMVYRILWFCSSKCYIWVKWYIYF